MSNPAVAPRVAYAVDSDSPVDVYWPFLKDPAFLAKLKAAKTLDTIQALLVDIDIEPRLSFYVPPEHTVDHRVLSRSGPSFALAKVGGLQPRLKSKYGHEVATAVWRAIPMGDRPPIHAKMSDTVYCDGGAHLTLGRLQQYAPRKGYNHDLQPVTEEEAAAGLLANGVDLMSHDSGVYRAYPLIAGADGEDKTKLSENPTASLGYPVLGRGNNQEARQKAHALAVAVRQELVVAVNQPGGIRGWLRRAEDERPWLVTLQGKAKADYYSSKKVEAFQLRFYNTFPRQIILNIQVATQAYEASKHTLWNDGRCRTTSGTSLTRGGGAQMVKRLDEQLAMRNFGYLHCGDDSWVVFRDAGNQLHMFALDCSSFDLTQDGRVTAKIHAAMRDDLATIDRIAADLWYAYMRERQIVLADALTARSRHMGVSGGALQSVVNGVLMDVAIHRLEKRLRPGLRAWSSLDLEKEMQIVGRSLGLVIRLEQHTVHTAGKTVRDALADVEFLFIGYRFYADEAGVIQVYCDLPRQMAQLSFPSVKWMAQGQEVAVKEAMRLGSIVMGWGIFPPRLRMAGVAGRIAALKLVTACIEQYGDQASPLLRWAVSESPYGPGTLPSLSALQRALAENDQMALWNTPPDDPTLLPVPLDAGWGDVAAVDEENERRTWGIPEPPRSAASLPRPANIGRRLVVPTHPITIRNWGRPPPTAVWGPPKPPLGRRAGRAVGRRVARTGVILPGDEEEWHVYQVGLEYGEADGSVYSHDGAETIGSDEGLDMMRAGYW